MTVRKLNQEGLNVNFHDEQADIIRNGKIISSAKVPDDLYKVQMDQIFSLKEGNKQKVCIHELHCLFGHKNVQSLQKMMNEAIVCFRVLQLSIRLQSMP